MSLQSLLSKSHKPLIEKNGGLGKKESKLSAATRDLAQTVLRHGAAQMLPAPTLTLQFWCEAVPLHGTQLGLL